MNNYHEETILEKIMENEAKQEDYKTSEETKDLFSALVKFQAMPKDIRRTAKNPHYKSKYAPLGEIINAIRDPMAECGLGFMQIPLNDNLLLTRIYHESGQFIESKYEMQPAGKGAQQKGSALTYQKRYALNAILGLDSEDDNDALDGKDDGKEEHREETWLNIDTQEWAMVVNRLKSNPDQINKVLEYYRISHKNIILLKEQAGIK